MYKIHFGKILAVPASLSGLAVIKVVGNHISDDKFQSRRILVRKFSLRQRNLFQLLSGHSHNVRISLINSLLQIHIRLQDRGHTLHMWNLRKLRHRGVHEVIVLGLVPVSGTDLDPCETSEGSVGFHGIFLQSDSQRDHDYDGGRADDNTQNGKSRPEFPSAQVIDAHDEQIKESHRPFPLSSFCV